MLDCYKIDGNFKTRFGKNILKKKDVLCCRIYLNDKFFGKIDASTKMDRQGYQYVITGLNPEESYDVKVKVWIDNCTTLQFHYYYLSFLNWTSETQTICDFEWANIGASVS